MSKMHSSRWGLHTLNIVRRSVQVARRVRGTDHLAKVEAGGKRRAVRYQCGLGQEEVFLHPHSALYKAAPEFVVYSQLIRSAKRPYMAGDKPILDFFSPTIVVIQEFRCLLQNTSLASRKRA